jgi:Na+-transporting methylmalonyl-CoA/oxaloacetate decarboxylase gamma subunit
MNNLLDITFNLENIGTDAIIISIIGYLVVFSVLVIMFIVFYSLSKILLYKAKQKCKNKGREDCAQAKDFTPSGDINAALSMTLYMYFNELHDEESGILTVKTISRRYSPWSSKIYSVMNNNLNKR